MTLVKRGFSGEVSYSPKATTGIALAENGFVPEKGGGRHHGERIDIVIVIIGREAEGPGGHVDIVEAQRKEHFRGGFFEAFFLIGDGLFPFAILQDGEGLLQHGMVVRPDQAVGKGGEMVIVHLRHGVEGVIVALRADDLGAEEELRGHREIVEGHAVVADRVTTGGISPGAPRGGDELVDEFVVGFIAADGGLDPLLVGEPGRHALPVAGQVGAGAEKIGAVIVLA